MRTLDEITAEWRQTSERTPWNRNEFGECTLMRRAKWAEDYADRLLAVVRAAEDVTEHREASIESDWYSVSGPKIRALVKVLGALLREGRG